MYRKNWRSEAYAICHKEISHTKGWVFVKDAMWIFFSLSEIKIGVGV